MHLFRGRPGLRMSHRPNRTPTGEDSRQRIHPGCQRKAPDRPLCTPTPTVYKGSSRSMRSLGPPPTWLKPPLSRSSPICIHCTERRKAETGRKHTFQIPFIKCPLFLIQMSEGLDPRQEADDTAFKPVVRMSVRHARQAPSHSQPSQDPGVSDSSWKRSVGGQGPTCSGR